MAAAADAGQSSDSYIGSFISLVSKAEIRYEGFLYHLSPQDSTIGLRNVKSFGTEGRRMDGPQVLSSDKVYEYIFFRGSDIKDLQVLSSPAPQSTPVLPNDPAIIQPNYPSLTPTSSSFPAVNAVPPPTSIGGNPQSGIQSPNYGENLPQNQPAGSSGSWGSFPLPPIANGNGVALPTYWPVLNGPSLGASHLPHQFLLGTPQSLTVSPPVQHMTPNSTMKASLPVDASNIAKSSFNSFPTIGLQPPSVTSAMAPQSTLPSSSTGHSSMLPLLPPNLMPNNTYNSLPAKTFGSNSLLVPPLVASSLDESPVVPPIVDKPISDFNPPLSDPTVSQPMQLINQSSGPGQNETSVPSLVTPGQLLQAKPARCSSLIPQTSYEDVAVDRVSKQKPLSSDSVHAVDTAPALPSFPVKKKKGTAQPNPNVKVHHARGKQNLELQGAASMNHRTYKGRPRAREHELHRAGQMNHRAHRGCPRVREHELHGVASMNHHAYRGCPSVREHEPNRADLHPNQTLNGHHQGRKIGLNTADGRTHSNVRGHGRGKRSQPNSGDGHFHHNANAASGWTYHNANTASGPTTHHYANTAGSRTTHHNANTASGHTHHSVRRRGKGRGAQVSPPVTSFANDFDFDAMNEKFNKEEIWGDLGKSNETRSNKDRGKGINYGANDTGEVNGYDPKPVYVKDDFFDSLSCHSLGAKLRRERAKLSELRKIDVETFGEIPNHRRGPRSREPGRGGQSRGSRRRRGYGYGGRGRGLDDGGLVT